MKRHRVFFGLLLESSDDESPNILRMMFDPKKVRPFVTNWNAVAEALIQRVHREAVGGAPDDATTRLLAELLAYPDVPQHWSTPDHTINAAPVLPIEFAKGDLVMRYFSTVTTLGTPQDITLQEIRIECFFPADRETEERARTLRA